MGGTRSSSVDWGNYSSSTTTRAQTFSSTFAGNTHVKADYDPKNIKVRESRDSPANPNCTPIIMALDCTGSMNDLAVSAVKNIGTLMQETYDRLPVPDPHIMAMFYDDVLVSPRNALQATQFEADKVIIDQLKDLYFVGNGGGNGSESTILPWHFALHKCACDAFAKGRKGFLFTLGDDGVPPRLSKGDLENVYGPDADPALLEEVSAEDLLAQVEENWHVFNLIPTRGHPRDQVAGYEGFALKSWEKLLGERAIVLMDIEKLAEVLVATMQVINGADAATVAASFTDPGTALVVRNAISALTPAGAAGGVVRF